MGSGNKQAFLSKIDFKVKLIKRDKEGHFILIQETVNQEDMTILDIFTKLGCPVSFFKVLLYARRQININPLIVGNFNTLLSPIDRSSGQKINRETSELIDIIYQKDFTDIYSIFQLNTKEYTFYLAAHGNFSKIDHILGPRTILHKFKEIKITPCSLSNRNVIKLTANKPIENIQAFEY